MSLLLRRVDEEQTIATAVKHLIAFLGYSQSRIQHPVYRQFVQAPLARRNATLLFQSRPLEERELVHEINELRRREGVQHCELMFHICASLTDPNMGQQIVQTVTLIHKLYDCPSYVYCLLPDLATCTDEQRKTAWKCLASINNGVTDYPHLRLISQCFVYTDATQKSLARFLYQLTNEPEALDFIERYRYMGKLVTRRNMQDVSYVPEFPGFMATFNATGINYPDEEIRYYIHQSYLNALLQLSRPQSNPIDMERCNEHVNALLGNLPLSNEELTLSADHFIELSQDARHKPWTRVADYWQLQLDNAIKDLEDRPHDEWLNVLKRSLEVCYQTKYRELGVDLFYANQKKLTSKYCAIVLEQLRLGLRQIMQHNPYPPETSQDIVRSLVNRLQQSSMSLNMQLSEGKEELKRIENKLNDLQKEWEAMGFFDRMRGKDKGLVGSYADELKHYYQRRNELHGADFGVKLLNELIPQISALPDAENHLGQICQAALEQTAHYLDNNPPTEFMDKNFEVQPVLDAAAAIRTDLNSLQHDYLLLLGLLYGTIAPRPDMAIMAPTDSDMLLQQLREALSEKIDGYIHARIGQGTMPPVLDVNVMERLASVYADRGGLTALVDQLKQETALTLKLKGEGGRKEQYLLIAPDCKELETRYIQSNDTSSVQMLHILTSISLTDLDGFSGQRLFVEPSMF